jgi:hypothetical protein
MTPPGNPTPALFRQPPALCGHPRHYTTLCGKASVNSVTLCHPLQYGRHVAHSKEDSGTLEKGTDTCPTSTWDNAVTSDWRSASPQSPPALCGHPRRCATFLGPVRPSLALWEPGTTRHCRARSCAPHGPPSAAPSSRHTDDGQTGGSHIATLEATPGREQDTP